MLSAQRYQRDTKRGAIRERTDRLHRLFYEMTEDEQNSYPSKPGPRDMAAREVMIDALIQLGSPRTAEALRSLGRGKLGGTLLHQKIKRTIFGPDSIWRPEHKPKKLTWLANVSGRSGLQRWITLSRNDILRGDGERPYLFEIGMGYQSAYKVVFSHNLEDALEDAEHRWPHLFLDELDEQDAEEAEERGEDVFPHPTKRKVLVRRSDNIAVSTPRAVVRGRIVDPDRRLAIVPSRISQSGQTEIVGYEE